MKELIKQYQALTFEEKTIFTTKFSIFLNIVLACAKFILAIFFEDVFFFVAGVFNIFIMISKLQCFFGIKFPEKKSFKYHNIMIAIFLFLSGFQYGVYMTRLVFHDADVMKYDMFLGIMVACVSFVEMGVAIKGCFNSYGKGHYYRNIKLINLCSALTAIVLTEMALMSFASEIDSRKLDGMFGMVVSVIIELIAVFILIAPHFSLVDREHNVYKLLDGHIKLDVKELNLKLTNSKYYGNYSYIAQVKESYIDGHIIQGKSRLFKWNIWITILVITLSEILIFPYALGALIYYFKNGALIEKLDERMLELGYEKVE